MSRRNDRGSSGYRGNRRPLVAAHPDAPLVGQLEADWKTVEARPVPPVRNAAQLANDDAEMRRYAEQEKVKAIFRDAPAQLEAAKKAGQAEADAWFIERAKQAKRDEDARIAKEIEKSRSTGPTINPRPIGR